MKKYKGFTIVELVIVIAVVALLAAVLIPTFSGIVKRANISADIQTARNMGVILAGEKPIGPREAVDALKANGIERLHPKMKLYSFFWIRSKNTVVLTAEGLRPIYPEEMATWPFDPYDWFDLTWEYQKTETEKEPEVPTPPTEDPTDPPAEETPPPPEYVTVTYTCNNPEYIKQSLETVTIKYGGHCQIQINVVDEGQYTITKYIVYQDGRPVMRSDQNELGTGVGFGASWGELRHNVEVYIHVVEYCVINFDGEGIKANKYKYHGLHVEAGTDTVLSADFLRENFIPDGCEIESVKVIMNGKEITDAYDPVKQELRLTNVTEDVTVTFEFKEVKNAGT